MPATNRSRQFSLGLVCLIALSGCRGNASADPMLAARIGEACTVYFRHDALGMAAGVPAPPTTGSHNGASVQLTGKLLRVNAGWVCIGVDNAEYTIPKEAILLVEMRSK
jgi:hypothetical protein